MYSVLAEIVGGSLSGSFIIFSVTDFNIWSV